MHRSASVGVTAAMLVGLAACQQAPVTTAKQAPSPAPAASAAQAGTGATARANRTAASTATPNAPAAAGRGGRGARPAANRAPRQLTHADSVRMAADSAAAAFYLARERRRDSIANALVVEQRTVRATADLTLPIVFDVRSADIRAAEQKALDRRVAILRANTAVHLRVEGTAHDDASNTANLALAMRRATAVKQYLIDHGIEADRIETTANPDADPVCRDPKTCWEENRRSEVLITAGGEQITPP